MKLVTKPIRKATVTESKTITGAACIASVLLTGAVALTATGCTTEVKADGITVENLIVSGSEYTGEIIDGLNNGSNLPVENKAPDGVIKADPTGVPGATATPSAVNPGNNGSQISNTPSNGTGTGNNTGNSSTKTVDENGNTVSGTNNDQGSTSELTSFAKIPEGTVYGMEYDNGFALNEDFGKVKIYPDGTKIAFVTDGAVSRADITSVTGFSDAWLIRSNGKTYLYIGVVRGCYNSELNVYEVTENSIERIGVENLIISGPSFDNTKSFKCYEYNGTDGQTDVISFVRNYKVSSNGMPIPADNYSELGPWIQVWAKNEMTGYIVKDGKVTSEQYTITKGEPVEPVAVNEVEYIDIKNSKNMIVRVDFTDLCCEYYDQNDYRWTYKAVMSLFDSEINAYTDDLDNLGDKAVIAFTEGRDGTVWADGVYGSFFIEPYGDRTLRITYNSRSYTVNCDFTDSKTPVISKAYLTKADGKVFILVQTILENDLRMINIYSVTSDSIIFEGNDSLSFDGEVRTPYAIICYEYDHMNGVISIKNGYRLTGEGILVPCSDEYILSSSCTVKAREDLNGQVIRDGSLVNEYRLIKKGEIVELLTTDKENYIDVMTTDGVVLRIYCKSTFDYYYNANEGYKTFEAILSLIEPA